MRKAEIALTIVLFAACVIAAAYGTSSAQLTAIANNDRIDIGFFYHGSTVSVRGVSDPGADLVIKITSPEGHQALKRRGKVGGVLWMNIGELKFENVPNLYSLHSTGKLEDILTREEREQHVLGYPAMEKHMGISPLPVQEEKDTWFNEFLKYKQASNLYTADSGKISTMMRGGQQQYYIRTAWPYQAAPGDYVVTVYAVKAGKIFEKAESKVTVRQVGIVKTLATMAKNNGALYGLISILAALGAGFVVGLIFKGGGSH